MASESLVSDRRYHPGPRAGGFWHAQAPTPAAMASRTPFCADTLVCSERLQFVFLPRMRMLIESGDRLPSDSAIAVFARETLAERPGRQAVIEALERFDQTITRAA